MDYYDVSLKQRRHAILLQTPGFSEIEAMLEDLARLNAAEDEFQPDVIVRLTAISEELLYSHDGIKSDDLTNKRSTISFQAEFTLVNNT